MKVELAFEPKEAADFSFQRPSPTSTECCRCGGLSRLAFVAHETEKPEDGKYVADIHLNEPDGDGFWPHDACAVAVYFCTLCLQPTALFNQA